MGLPRVFGGFAFSPDILPAAVFGGLKC